MPDEVFRLGIYVGDGGIDVCEGDVEQKVLGHVLGS
jgi:hypothetical protein